MRLSLFLVFFYVEKMSQFILDNQFNVISVESNGEWEDFIQFEYPSLCRNMPFHEQKDVVIYLVFNGRNKYNLFQIVITDYFNNTIDFSTNTLTTYDDALELYHMTVNKWLVV